jgi:ABC-type amino acid transport substrate-binding protein
MMMGASLVTSFAPAGLLRASINLGNPVLANKDPATGQPVGVSIDLAHAWAERLGVAAGVKQQLQVDAARVSGLRLLPGRVMVIGQAMGTPKSRGVAPAQA